MASQPKLDAETEWRIDDLIASGRFADRLAVLRYGVRLAHDEEQATEPLDAELIALLEARIAEADAHPEALIPAEQVFAELERRCLDEVERQRSGQ